MTADQSGDNHPSFEDLLKGQLDPFLRQDAAQRKIMREAEGIVSNADESQQIHEFQERRNRVCDLLGKFNVEERLTHIGKSVWRRGVIEPIIEDTTDDKDKPVGAKGKTLVGYRMTYCSPAVVEFEGTHQIYVSSGLDGYTYDREKYFPVSETQRMEIVASPDTLTPTLNVHTSSTLDAPTRMKLSHGTLYNQEGETFVPFPFMRYDADNEFYRRKLYRKGVSLGEKKWVDLDFSYTIADSGLYKAKITEIEGFRLTTDMRRAILEMVNKLEHPEVEISDQVKEALESSSFVVQREYKAQTPEDFDNFIVLDCKERIQNGKLPLQTRENWLRYIEGPDFYDEFFKFHRTWIGEPGTPNRRKSPAFSDQPSSPFYYTDEIEIPYFGSHFVHGTTIWDKGHLEWGDLLPKVALVCADFSRVRDSVMQEMSATEINTFKSTFEKENGFPFDDIVEWMRGAPRITHRGNGIFMDEEELNATNSLVDKFNKANADLGYQVSNQEAGLARDQAAIKLVILAYHYKLDRIRTLGSEHWGRFLLETGSKIWRV